MTTTQNATDSTYDVANGYEVGLSTDGTARCWGFNGYGQLGDGTTSDAHTPVVVSGFNAGTNAVAITAGSSHYS